MPSRSYSGFSWQPPLSKGHRGQAGLSHGPLQGYFCLGQNCIWQLRICTLNLDSMPVCKRKICGEAELRERGRLPLLPPQNESLTLNEWNSNLMSASQTLEGYVHTCQGKASSAGRSTWRSCPAHSALIPSIPFSSEQQMYTHHPSTSLSILKVVITWKQYLRK